MLLQLGEFRLQFENLVFTAKDGRRCLAIAAAVQITAGVNPMTVQQITAQRYKITAGVAVLDLRGRRGQIGGVPGLLGATLGLLGPTAVLSWLVAGLVRRLAHAPWLKPAQAGLVPLAIGLVAASGMVMARGAAAWALAPAITCAATVFVWRSSYSPLWVLAAGAALGVLASL